MYIYIVVTINVIKFQSELSSKEKREISLLCWFIFREVRIRGIKSLVPGSDPESLTCEVGRGRMLAGAQLPPTCSK